MQKKKCNYRKPHDLAENTIYKTNHVSTQNRVKSRAENYTGKTEHEGSMCVMGRVSGGMKTLNPGFPQQEVNNRHSVY